MLLGRGPCHCQLFAYSFARSGLYLVCSPALLAWNALAVLARVPPACGCSQRRVHGSRRRSPSCRTMSASTILHRDAAACVRAVAKKPSGTLCSLEGLHYVRNTAARIRGGALPSAFSPPHPPSLPPTPATVGGARPLRTLPPPPSFVGLSGAEDRQLRRRSVLVSHTRSESGARSWSFRARRFPGLHTAKFQWTRKALIR